MCIRKEVSIFLYRCRSVFFAIENLSVKSQEEVKFTKAIINNEWGRFPFVLATNYCF